MPWDVNSTKFHRLSWIAYVQVTCGTWDEGYPFLVAATVTVGYLWMALTLLTLTGIDIRVAFEMHLYGGGYTCTVG